MEYINKGKRLRCPYCGATAEYVGLILRTYRTTPYSTQADVYARWQCMSDDCEAIFHDKVIE